MKQRTAICLFILILFLAKLSEPRRETEPPPEPQLIWRDGDRILTRDGFFDIPRGEREHLLEML